MKIESLTNKILTVDEKCAEIYRNTNKGTFTFLCFACGKIFDAFGGDEIFKHLAEHYNFEGQGDTETDAIDIKLEEDDTQSLHHVEEVFLDAQLPIFIEPCEETKVCSPGKKIVEDEVLHPVEEVNIDAAQLPQISEEFSMESSTSNSLGKKRNLRHDKQILKNNMLKCKKCGNVLKTIKSFKEHMFTHFNRKQLYECKFCDEAFGRPRKLYTHYKTIHREKKKEGFIIEHEIATIQCIFCEEIFKTKGEKLKHCREQHPQFYKTRRHYTSDVTSKSEEIEHCIDTDTVEKVPEKNRKNTDNINKNCDICKQTFETKGKYEVHMQTHSETKYSCDLCGKIFGIAYNLKRHMRAQHSKDDIPREKCDICSKTFKNKRVYNSHIQTHSQGHHRCDQCGKIFGMRGYLQKHINFIHNPKVIRKPCSVCGIEVIRLKDHMKTHSQREKLFECTQCNKKYMNKTELNLHMISHTGIKPFQCEVCGKGFSKVSLLEDHKRRQHTGERPVQCQFCDERFFDNSQKKEHERKHTKEKPYKCDECEMSFRTSNILYQHKDLHASERKYSCKYCDMKFTQASGRRSHEKNKHGVE